MKDFKSSVRWLGIISIVALIMVSIGGHVPKQSNVLGKIFRSDIAADVSLSEVNTGLVSMDADKKILQHYIGNFF